MPIEPVLLDLGARLVVADQLVVLRELIGGLGREVAEVRLVRLDREVRVADRGIERADRRVPPQPVLLEVAAEVRVDVAIAVQPVDVARRQAAAAGHAGRNLLVADVVRLPVAVLVVAVERAVIRVAARLADQLCIDARHRALGARRAAADRDLLERSVVDVVAEPAGAFGRVDALHHRPVLTGGAVDEVGGLRAGSAAADVDALQLHAGRFRQNRPVVARARQVRERLLVERGGDRGRLHVDDGRVAGDDDVLLQRGQAHDHVDRGGEAGGQADAFACDRPEARQLERERVLARRHRDEPVEPGFVRDRSLDAHHRGARQADGDARQHALRVVGDSAVDRGGGRARGLRARPGGDERHQQRGSDRVTQHRKNPP